MLIDSVAFGNYSISMDIDMAYVMNDRFLQVPSDVFDGFETSIFEANETLGQSMT